METFVLIIIYSVFVLFALSAFAGVLVAASNWLIDNSAETLEH